MVQWLQHLTLEGLRFESHLGRNLKTLTVHPTANGYLTTIIGEDLRGRKETIGHHLSYAVAKDMMEF